MSYTRVKRVLPMDILELIQEYIDGEYIYIPRKSGSKQEWGSRTSIRKELACRDREIFRDYQSGGCSSGYLAQKYFLSVKSIQRIIRQEKMKDF